MSCTRLQMGYRREGGGQLVMKADAPGVIKQQPFPCGTCIGCRRDQARDWGIRSLHEARMHASGFDNAFVTLTYNDEHLPAGNTLVKRHMQLFMMRLRKSIGGPYGLDPGRKISDYYVGEYGEFNRRPHYHAMIFNWRFPDREYWRKGESGFNLYRSAQLERLWPYGHCEVGDVSLASATYCASYCVKKATGKLATMPYQVVVPETGEIVMWQPEFAEMSRAQGIGARWFRRWGMTDAFPQDFVIVEGRKLPVPRYYDKLLKRTDPGLLSEIQAEREKVARDRQLANPGEYTRRRLQAIEECAMAGSDRFAALRSM